MSFHHGGRFHHLLNRGQGRERGVKCQRLHVCLIYHHHTTKEGPTQHEVARAPKQIRMPPPPPSSVSSPPPILPESYGKWNPLCCKHNRKVTTMDGCAATTGRFSFIVRCTASTVTLGMTLFRRSSITKDMLDSTPREKMLHVSFTCVDLVRSYGKLQVFCMCRYRKVVLVCKKAPTRAKPSKFPISLLDISKCSKVLRYLHHFEIWRRRMGRGGGGGGSIKGNHKRDGKEKPRKQKEN
jgi:hypothetical protein